MEEVLVSLLDNILGEHEKESGDWYSYNCPKCAENEGIDCDHKGNLEVNVYEGWCHCWKCNYASDILRLIKPYATKEQYDEYVYNLKLIRDSSLYELNGTNSNTIIERMVDVTLPDGYSEITKETTNDAVEYLFKRGIGFDIIKRFNIGFTKNSSEAFNRIIIPSYNRFGSLNYWVGRDYTGKSKLKYKNPKVEKRGFVFNEWLINWY